jgi:hypothetical protein
MRESGQFTGWGRVLPAACLRHVVAAGNRLAA